MPELRSFVCGELGWTLDKWKHSTLTEINLLIEGYWRNWERNTAWLMREIVFELINGNPYIQGTKPGSSKEVYGLTDDKAKQSPIARKPSPEELEEAGKLLKELQNKQ